MGGREDMPEHPSRGASRSMRGFAAFLAVSIAAHAAVFLGLSLPVPDGERTLPASLEVLILPPESPPAAVEPPAPQQRSRAPAREAAPPPPPARKEPKRAIAPPEAPTDASSHAATADSPDAPFAQPAESPPSPPAKAGPNEGVATSQTPPPRINAAYLSNPRPRYPDAARRAGEQGTVTLRVLVTREGLAARVRVEKSSGSAHLDQAALEAVRAWRFTPARQGADRIESWMLVPVVFRLEAAS